RARALRGPRPRARCDDRVRDPCARDLPADRPPRPRRARRRSARRSPGDGGARSRWARARAHRADLGVAPHYSTTSPGQTACRLLLLEVIMKAWAPAMMDAEVTVTVRCSFSPFRPCVRSHAKLSDLGMP